MDTREIIFTVILIIIGAAGFGYSLFLPSHGNIALSPGLFPGVVSILLFLLNLYHLISGLIKKGISKKTKKTGKRKLILILSFFPAYMILLYYAHFIFSTFIFLVLTMAFLHKKFYWRTPVISGAAVVVIYYLFRELLNVRLP